MLGSPFFWLLFFGEAKKSDSAAAKADETLPHCKDKRVKPETLDSKPQS